VTSEFVARDAARLRNAILDRQTQIKGANRDFPMEIISLAGDRQAFLPEWYPGGATSWSEGKGMMVVDQRAERCADDLVRWHELGMRRAVPYYFAGDLIEHAWRVEAGFPEAKIEPEDYVSRYGFALLGRGLPLRTPRGHEFTLRAISWAPVEDCPWKPKFVDAERGGAHGWVPTVVLGHDWRSEATGLIHFRLWIDHDSTACGLAEEHDFTLSARSFTPPVGHDSGEFHQLARALGIAFQIAQQPDVGLVAEEPVNPATVKRARAVRVERYRDPVRVMSLRPRTAQGLRDMGQLGEDGPGRVRGRYRYVKICWPVRDSIDPDTGEVRKRGKIYYRNRDLLADDPGDTVRAASLPKHRK
jgi:hypothetical protein